MQINWFPGHMKKTLENIEKDLKGIDIVLYVLDSRAPLACLNPVIDKLVANKKVLYVINKCDLITVEAQKKILAYLKSQNKEAICLEGTKSSSKSLLLNKMKEIMKDKIQRFKEKQVFPIFKVMVLGTPNTGKSTIINTLCSQKKTMTGDKAGVTKSKQWVKISENFALLDTPGTLWQKLEDQNMALKLAYIGSISKDAIDVSEVGFNLVKTLISSHPSELCNRYKLDSASGEPIEVYDNILRNMGSIRRGGEIDYERGANIVLNDFRTGKIGKICLDFV